MKYFFYLLLLISFCLLLFGTISYMNVKQIKYKEHIDEQNILLDSLFMELDTLKIIHNELNEALDGLPLKSPLKTIIVDDKYGYRRDPFTRKHRFHSGIDFKGNSKDTIFSTGKGIIKKASWRAGYGRCVIIKHVDGFESLYAHMSKVLVAVGDSINKHDPIGKIGSTGRSTGTHLHYEIIRNGKNLDPYNFLILPLKGDCN